MKSIVMTRRTCFAELILVLAMLGTIASPVSAQENKDGAEVSDPAAKESGAILPNPFDNTWKIALGAGAINGPRYPGSRDNFTRGLPLASVSYGRYFIGAIPGGGAPAGAGAYLLHTEHWVIGTDIGGDFRQPRRASDDPVLLGWGNIPKTVRGGMFASYTRDWLSASGSISGDLGNHHEGVIASFSLSAKCHPAPGLTLSIGPQVTWVNDQYARTFFGIDATAFKPEYIGKMNFYLSAVDDQLHHADDRLSIGLILCKTRSKVIAEYALRNPTTPVGVTRYTTKLLDSLPAELKDSLPSPQDIEAELVSSEGN
jgi:outer membrane scaffolding protein for murein synthesis (MipA/OmpV family)